MAVSTYGAGYYGSSIYGFGLTSPGIHSYVTLEAFKSHLNITDTARDDLCVLSICGASSQTDKGCGRTFEVPTVATQKIIRPLGNVLQDGDGQHLRVPDIASATDLVVEYGTTAGGWTVIDAASIELGIITTFLPTNWIGYINGAFPVGGGTRIRVTARFGWPSVPNDIVIATLIQSARLFKRRDSPEGVLGSADWGVIRVGRTDPDVSALTAPFTSPGMA